VTDPPERQEEGDAEEEEAEEAEEEEAEEAEEEEEGEGEGEGEGGGERVGGVETEEGEEEVDLCTTMDEEEASRMLESLPGFIGCLRFL
jgi:hypothetical protein